MTSRPSVAVPEEQPNPVASTSEVVSISPQARKNLGLISRPVKLETYWRTVVIPGEVADRPGMTDRRVAAPAAGVIVQMHAYPGDTVRPGERLTTIRLTSETVQTAQSELFKAVRESELVREQRDRLHAAAEAGAVPRARMIELDQQLKRLQAAMRGYEQELLVRGLDSTHLNSIAAGTFVTTIDVVAPPMAPSAIAPTDKGDDTVESLAEDEFGYEVQELRADLGTQVEAGQQLAVLADHRSLYLVGHAFKRDAPHLDRAAQQHWPVQVEFLDSQLTAWPAIDQRFEIRHLANAVDPDSRTFDFFIPLENQSRTYMSDGQRFIVWRFRPGQRVRLHVPVEELNDVIVLPMEAVVREGPEAYVFRQNGDLFNRLPVQVLHEDMRHVVLANDGSIAPGWYLAQSDAAALNRVLKAQDASGMPAGVHVHADGTVHAAH